MLLPDANVLVYAHREDTDDHGHYRDWLTGLVNFPRAYGLSDLVLSGFLRVVTHPGEFREPSPLDQALAFATEIRERPSRRLPRTGRQTHGRRSGGHARSAHRSSTRRSTRTACRRATPRWAGDSRGDGQAVKHADGPAASEALTREKPPAGSGGFFQDCVRWIPPGGVHRGVGLRPVSSGNSLLCPGFRPSGGPGRCPPIPL